MPRATIDDVATKAGVSVATVSRALRGLPNVAETTRQRVELAALDLGYRPHTAAAWLASGRTRSVGVAAPWFRTWYTGAVLNGVQQVLSSAGYDLVLYGTHTAQHRQQFLERVPDLQTRVDGLLLIDFDLEPEHMVRLENSGLALVSVGVAQPGLTSVGIDNHGAAKAGVDYLVDRGHRRIAIAGTERSTQSRPAVLNARRAGYRAALREAGIDPDPSLEYGGPLDVAHGPEALEQLLAVEPRPTAIFLLSDEMAMGALGAARRNSIDIPGTVSLMGFDDHDLSDAAGLTTVRQPVRDQGAVAAEILLGMFRDEVPTTERHTLECEVVERQSVGYR